MRIREDFTARVVVKTADEQWLESPMAGVLRKPLDRVGAEVARATSLVKYAPNSHFSAHTHTGGEEFLVLEGVFQDEHGDFPAGTYVRNPPTTKHIPRSDEGCVIFVKLWQYDLSDRDQKFINIFDSSHEWTKSEAGVEYLELHTDSREAVFALKLQRDQLYVCTKTEGAEVLVLNGKVQESDDVLTQNTWLRVPKGSGLKLTGYAENSLVWIKMGHLRFVEAEIENLHDHQSS